MYDNEKLFNACLSILKAYPLMDYIWQIANFSFIYKDKESMDEVFYKMKDANKKTIENGAELIEEDSTILTYSRSSIVESILKKCKDKNIKAICSESRPRYEGRRLAKNKPVYVASSSYKTFPFVFIKEEKEEEIWKNAPHEISIKKKSLNLSRKYLRKF